MRCTGTQATQAGDLAVRKAGRYGSCSAEINGLPKLMYQLSALPPGPVMVTLLRTFSVIRDLVTDVSGNNRRAQQIPSFTLPARLHLASTGWPMLMCSAVRSSEGASRLAVPGRVPGNP
jgi:succinate dehydrogenase/fumarate reductase-like Fe-S protein